ncbi:MAG: histidine phosphatase family protein [Anaerolineae bacterium]|nr:histidine phosphatase family protein [Anaerolineae bacterium]
MTTTILLIRHGQTEYNATGRWQGHLDVPLNETGKTQAKALAQRLKNWPVAAVYSSDLTRAAMTAVYLSETWGLTPTYDPAWRERDVGVFEGRDAEELKREYPEVWANMRHGIYDIPGSESHEVLQSRAVAAYERVVAAYPAEMVAVVSHGGTLNTVVSHILGIPKGQYGRLNFRGNTGLTIIEINDRGPRLTMINDTRHLENGDYRD